MSRISGAIQFFELGYLETKFAHLIGGQSTIAQEANIAALSIADSSYQGSVDIGDRCGEHDHEPEHQRQDLVNRVAQFKAVAERYKIIGHTLVRDPALSSWVCSPKFQKDMDGLKSPERRAWAVNVEHVSRALLNTRIFGAR